ESLDLAPAQAPPAALPSFSLTGGDERAPSAEAERMVQSDTEPAPPAMARETEENAIRAEEDALPPSDGRLGSIEEPSTQLMPIALDAAAAVQDEREASAVEPASAPPLHAVPVAATEPSPEPLEISALVDPPVPDAPSSTSEVSDPIVGEHVPAEPPVDVAADIEMIDKAAAEKEPAPAVPGVLGAAAPPKFAQQEHAARQALTNDLADLINSVLTTTQFASRAMKPKRYAEVQPLNEPESSELAEEPATPLPHPVAIQSRLGRSERLLAFASVGLMVVIGYFAFSLWRDDNATAQAPTIAAAASRS